ncbi:hypothetical protein [Photobacterium kishitanii]|uniref:Uncharacterized protein n=1 Tax=Photobacterium kishitanii TaxID=318456 RepID=A0A2T3KL66_9GAMM|nr:hypothetical protein [Photobacterium kishitanii]PSV00399.1 hypothetical protein C9J27_04525 [Photobacterium kishitanii]
MTTVVFQRKIQKEDIAEEIYQWLQKQDVSVVAELRGNLLNHTVVLSSPTSQSAEFISVSDMQDMLESLSGVDVEINTEIVNVGDCSIQKYEGFLNNEHDVILHATPFFKDEKSVVEDLFYQCVELGLIARTDSEKGTYFRLCTTENTAKCEK